MASQTWPDAAHVRSRQAEAGDGASAGRLPAPRTRGMRVDASRVSLRVHGQQTLRNVSVSIAPGELVAVVGSSGAGKTMLLETLAGLRRPDDGTVWYDGVPCHGNLAVFRSWLGYVPQDDIIHRELPLGRTLEYAARLRLPAAPGRPRPPRRPAACSACSAWLTGGTSRSDRCRAESANGPASAWSC